LSLRSAVSVGTVVDTVDVAVIRAGVHPGVDFDTIGEDVTDVAGVDVVNDAAVPTL
jgi:hypothetical protein